MAGPEPNLRAVLEGVNWQELTKRLLLLTHQFVRERYIPGKSPGDLGLRDKTSLALYSGQV
jgi:hypothetical protein